MNGRFMHFQEETTPSTTLVKSARTFSKLLFSETFPCHSCGICNVVYLYSFLLTIISVVVDVRWRDVNIDGQEIIS